MAGMFSDRNTDQTMTLEIRIRTKIVPFIVLLILIWTAPASYGAPRVEFEGTIYEYENFPQELLEGKSSSEKRYLLSNWPNLDASLRERLAAYFKCKQELKQFVTTLETAQRNKAEIDKEYERATIGIKNMLLKAMARLGLMTATVLTDAVTDFQAGLKKARDAMGPDSTKGLKEKREMLEEFNRQMDVLKQLTGQKGLATEKVWNLERKIYAATIDVYGATPIDESTPDFYKKVDPHSPLFYAEAQVRSGPGFMPGGELSLNFRNKFLDPKTGKELMRGSVLRGYEEFAGAIRHFKGQFEAIRGDWQFGDNLTEFHKNLGKGMTEQGAALNTWTGQQAVAAGYTKAIVRQNTPNHVIVTFVRP